MNRERTGATVGYKNVGEFTAYGVSAIEFTAYGFSTIVYGQWSFNAGVYGL